MLLSLKTSVKPSPASIYNSSLSLSTVFFKNYEKHNEAIYNDNRQQLLLHPFIHVEQFLQISIHLSHTVLLINGSILFT